MSNDKWLSPKEAAKRLGVSTKTISRWADTGKILVLRSPAKMRRIPLSEVERILGYSQNILRCCIYIRVRSKKDITNGIAEKQKEVLLAVAQNYGYEVISVIIEVGSALKENRSNLVKMLNQATQKEFNVLLINDKNSILPFGFYYLEEQLSLLGIQTHILEQDLTVTSIKETVKDTLTILINLLKLLFAKEKNQKIKTVWTKLYQIMRTIKNL